VDGLTFTSELVKSLAWPAATVGIVLLLRKPMGKLLVLLKKLKYGDLEAEFGELVQQAAKEVATAENVLASNKSPLAERLFELASVSPVGAS
jgi:hypothetical protein